MRMAFWFFVLGVPLLAAGLAALARTSGAAAWLVRFPRDRHMGWFLCAAGWMFTAYEIDTIGIDVFDRIVRRLWFLQNDLPGAVWIWAVILTILTCWWMPNLLPIRGASALLMLFPAELFPAIRLCDTSWRLALVVFAYICAMFGMFAMFYPWHVRRLLAWCAASERRVRCAGAISLSIGGMFIVLGICSLCGILS